jgi:hypothetical protein
MISKDQTDLKLYHIEEEEPTFYVAFLLEKRVSETFDVNAFMNALGTLDDEVKAEDEVDVEISQLMHAHGVLEMFDKEEIEKMAKDDLIDTDDLHGSLYEVYITEQT